MSIYLVNFATSNFFGNQKIQNYSAKKYKIDGIISRNAEWLINKEFYKKNKRIFNVTKGFGLWAWKPFVILNALQKLDPNDVLLYLDSDFYICNPIEPLVDLCHKTNGITLFRGGHLCKNWIKRDCFDLMGCDSKEFYNMPILVAGLNLWKNNEKNISFLKGWLNLCQDFNLISDEPSSCGKPELTDFKAHRHDQAILTLLAAKNYIEVYRNPTIDSKKIEMNNSPYGIILCAQEGRIGDNRKFINERISILDNMGFK